MAGKQAKILSDANIGDLLLYAETTRQSARDRTMVLLSAKAGTARYRLIERLCDSWRGCPGIWKLKSPSPKFGIALINQQGRVLID